MERVAEPLTRMGARVETRSGCAPLRISGGGLLCGTVHQLPQASAQVKSAILLAATRAGVGVRLREPGPSRDHTERMLGMAGRQVKRLGGGWLELKAGPGNLDLPAELTIPRDPSSAAFFWVAAAVTGGRVETPEVGVNPTRTGILDLLRQAGARVELSAESEDAMGEPVATVLVEGGELRPIVLQGDDVVRSIDEIPILAVMAAVARGRSVVRDAAELRTKESDRIHALCSGLRAFGVRIEEQGDGFVIEGGQEFARNVRVDAMGDHRLAMTFAIAAMCGHGVGRISNAECINVSYPGFAAEIGARWEA
jgi:3-phosphoshikimate 1-carboxyvinyltransferase